MPIGCCKYLVKFKGGGVAYRTLGLAWGTWGMVGEMNEVGAAVNTEEVAEQQSKLGVYLTCMLGRDGVNMTEAEL